MYILYTREAEKSSFFNDRAHKALTSPPPLGLNGRRNFVRRIFSPYGTAVNFFFAAFPRQEL